MIRKYRAEQKDVHFASTSMIQLIRRYVLKTRLSVCGNLIPKRKAGARSDRARRLQILCVRSLFVKYNSLLEQYLTLSNYFVLQGRPAMDRYKVTWISKNIQQSAIVSANSATEAKAKVKRARPNGEYKNMTAFKMQ